MTEEQEKGEQTFEKDSIKNGGQLDHTSALDFADPIFWHTCQTRVALKQLSDGGLPVNVGSFSSALSAYMVPAPANRLVLGDAAILPDLDHQSRPEHCGIRS